MESKDYNINIVGLISKRWTAKKFHTFRMNRIAKEPDLRSETSHVEKRWEVGKNAGTYKDFCAGKGMTLFYSLENLKLRAGIV